MKALEASSLSVRLGDREVLQGVSLALEAGELAGVLGPNGAGKTTLLHTLCGVLAPCAGEVLVGGEPLARSSRKKIALVPQQVRFDPFAPGTVEEVVLIGRLAHAGILRPFSRADREVARRAMEEMGISHLSGRAYAELSGGEKQKVQIARAVAQEPLVLLLDEPTANLDPKWQAQVSDCAARIAGGGMAVLMVTHEIHHLPPGASRVLLLAGGRVISDGRPGETLTQEHLRELYGCEVEVSEARGRRYLSGGA